MPTNRDEKGRIAPAQSKVALSMRTMGQIAAKQGGQKFGKHAYGEVHHGVSGMARMADLKEANKGKKAKSRVVLRGQKQEFRKGFTKGFKENLKGQPGLSSHVKKAGEERLGRMVREEAIIGRGQKSDYRKSYTKIGARMHKKGLLHG